MNGSLEDLVGSPDPFAGKSIEQIVAFCRASGITKLDWRGLHLELGPAPAEPVDYQKFAEILQSSIPDDVDLLGWSAGGDFAKDIAAIQKVLNDIAEAPVPGSES